MIWGESSVPTRTVAFPVVSAATAVMPPTIMTATTAADTRMPRVPRRTSLIGIRPAHRHTRQ
ncbi:hypothetical protein QE428_002406 [Microbacterium sp. SORGH_AS 505]|uniref:hypothetical protein n=1 Tax=Microbacterium sp. SORGH_AS_0505 TaxID=3041770 RepID=UPI0027840A24|nr:hypothetical protein [Microbacterium sp. SORGH_AS_0505]MDQ1127373.1 hypothetical protein [Microbacterium sp. SORGH_AS_0505]